MTLDADMTPVGGGLLTLDGVFSREQLGGFTLAGNLTDVQLGTVIDRMPESRATGTFGVIALPGDERARIVAEISDSEFLHLPIRSAHLLGSLLDGVLYVDSALAVTAAARIGAVGRLGVDSTTSGALRIVAQGDSLAQLAPMLGLCDTLMAGVGEFDGVLEGNTYALRLHGGGRLGAGTISVYAANTAEYEGTMLWRRGALPTAEFSVSAHGARVAERVLGDIDLDASVDGALRGHVDLTVRTPFEQRYELTTDYAVHGDTTDLFVERLDRVKRGNEARKVPRVLANSHAHALARDRRDQRRVARREVAGLVENVVIRQKLFVVAGRDLAVLKHTRGVVKAPVRAAIRERADDLGVLLETE
jgi:hypothetical protein